MRIRRAAWSGVLLAFLFVGSLAAAITPPFVAETTAPTVNLRAGPNINFETLANLSKGTQFVVEEELYDWYKVELPITTPLFISASYLKPLSKKGTATITGNTVNVRARPTIKATIVTQVKKDHEVRFIEKANDWYTIVPPSASYGWVKKTLTRFVSSDIAAFKNQQRPESLTPENGNTKTAEKTDSGETTVEGVLKSFFKLFGSSAQYKLIIDGQMAYVIEGPQQLLQKNNSSRVKITGTIQSPTSAYGVPVLAATDIETLE